MEKKQTKKYKHRKKRIRLSTMKLIRIRKQRVKKAGLPPGILIRPEEKLAEKVKIALIDYNEHKCKEKEVDTIKECCEYKDKPTVTWINVEGIYSTEIIEEIGNVFNISDLLLEDIMNTDQRPKIEYHKDYIFIVLKMLTFDSQKSELQSEQISLIITPHFVITLQEGKEGDVFNIIRERIRNDKGRIRKMGNDYLAYALIDAIVDNYFVILESIGERIEETEDRLFANPTKDSAQDIHDLKRKMLFLFKSVWPLREVISQLAKAESPIIKENTGIFIKDIYDHTIQIIDTIETFRDILSEMFDIYLSSISNRMNEIVKVLTIFAAIFSPLTFLAGVYGMNFHNFPELDFIWSYPIWWIIVICIALTMLFFFKRKKWL